jgi:hypothetical protein
LRFGAGVGLASTLVLCGLVSVDAGCGARSALRQGVDADAAVVVPCVIDSDCPNDDLCAPQHCVEDRCAPLPPVNCDDGDECTEDSCEPSTGVCSSFPLTRDEDGDGHRGPRPGFSPNATGACGDDCDDTSAKAFPGGRELCDGTDNDCNGIVDDDSGYGPAGDSPVLVSSGNFNQANPGSISHNGSLYGVTFAGERDSWGNYFKGLSASGSTLIDQTPITNVIGTAFTGPLVWTGGMFGTAWSDRRQGMSYEVWFNRLDAKGKKLGPDVRVSDARGFSLDPVLLWNGNEFLIVWSDDSEGSFRVYGQRISATGELRGEVQGLTETSMSAESPSLAEGQNGLGLAFTLTGGRSVRQVAARVLGPTFGNPSEIVILGQSDSVEPVISFSRDRYVVVWEKKTAAARPGNAIWGATLTERGQVLDPERRLTSGTSGTDFARSPTVLPLGDRVLLIWSQSPAAGRYKLFGKMLSASLEELSPAIPIETGSGDSLYPSATFGPNGDVGVIFGDNQSGDWQVYFARLVCGAGR